LKPSVSPDEANKTARLVTTTSHTPHPQQKARRFCRAFRFNDLEQKIN
jgi:hypothetical protein